MRIASGSTDRQVYFVAVDATDLKTRETGLTGFTVYRSRNGGTATVYTTPTIVELSAANMPGVYALTIDEDTTVAAAHDVEEYCLHITHAAMAPVTRVLDLDVGLNTAVPITPVADSLYERVAALDNNYTAQRSMGLDLLLASFIQTSVVDTGATSGAFTLAAGLSSTNDWYNGRVLLFPVGALNGLDATARMITDYIGGTRQVLFTGTGEDADRPFPAAPANGQVCLIGGIIGT